MTRHRLLLVLGAVAALQAALWLGYRLVTEWRREAPDVSAEDRAGQRVPLDAPLVRRGGGTTALSELVGSKPVLLHFWATWCVPCQAELPTLLELSRSADRPRELQIVLVSLDRNWEPVDAFFDGSVPAQVLRDGGRLARTMGVRELPDTYLVAASGAQVARFLGARDWLAPELGSELERWLAPSGR